MKVVYSTLWITFVYVPLSRRVYEQVKLNSHLSSTSDWHVRRFPKSLSYVILDTLEKVYLAGFPVLLAFTSIFPALMERRRISADICIPSDEFSCPEPEGQLGTGMSHTMEFLPLMLTSVYCAIGLVWGFLRLMFIYLHEETTYQGQLSGLQ